MSIFAIFNISELIKGVKLAKLNHKNFPTKLVTFMYNKNFKTIQYSNIWPVHSIKHLFKSVLNNYDR